MSLPLIHSYIDSGILSSYDFTGNAKNKRKMYSIINNVKMVNTAMAPGRPAGYNLYGDVQFFSEKLLRFFI